MEVVFDTRLYRDAQADSFVLQKGLVANKVEVVLTLEPSNLKKRKVKEILYALLYLSEKKLSSLSCSVNLIDL